MWIAFIFQYLWDTTQQLPNTRNKSISCELLSFFSIFGIQHNFILFFQSVYRVVNCFHFSVSLGYNTTLSTWKTLIRMLWIAFIFQYLWDTTQLKHLTHLQRNSCELLSFFSIFGIQHNKIRKSLTTLLVVNCFHFSVSLGYNTTRRKLALTLLLLWIAFIFQYLWDTTQPTYYLKIHKKCCELLSFFSIFGIQHNMKSQ